jgi:predicted transcriptional regulator
MGVGEKIKLALKGDKEARTILLKSTNRQIYMSVLENPGIKESEIEMLTKNSSTNSEILRAIGRNREWAVNRNVMKNLVMNSKTPVEVSNRFLTRMPARDLEIIDKSRNLPMAVRSNARRLLEQKKKGR